jgi:hypothetical protein
MALFQAFLLVFLGLSLAGNVAQFLHHRRTRGKRQPDITAQEVLARIFGAHGAVLRVQVVDPGDIMLISPRDRA